MQIFSNVFGAVKSVMTMPVEKLFSKEAQLPSLLDVVSIGAIKQAQDKMITTIAEKMCNDVVTPESLNALMAQFDKKDHPYVYEILKQCSLALNPADIMETIADLQPAINKAFNKSTSDVNWLSLDTLKPGLSLMYHLRKKGDSIPYSNCLGPSLYGKDAPKDFLPQNACLMDTIFSKVLTTEEIDLLASIPQLATANVGNFEAGISYTDWVTGKATEKVKDLVTKVKARQKVATTKDVSKATLDVLNQPLAENIKRLNQARSALGHPPVQSFTLESSLSRESVPIKKPQKALLDYFQTSNPTPKKIVETIEVIASNPDEKTLFTKLLSSPNGFEFFNVAKTMEGLKTIENNLLKQLKEDQLKPENIRIVTDLDPGKSSSLLTYLFQQQTATFKPEQFVTKD